MGWEAYITNQSYICSNSVRSLLAMPSAPLLLTALHTRGLKRDEV